MTRAKQNLLLLFVLLPACACQFPHQEPSSVAGKEQLEQKKEDKPPTFTYRPGS
jgi:hypothetical protein